MATTPDVLGHKAERSDVLDHAARFGLISYGVLHLMLAWLAVQLALGDGSGSASTSGALRELAQTGLGRVSLYVVAAGFAALVLWQAAEALLGHRDEDGAKRAGRRLVSAGKVVVYAFLGLSALRIAVGSSSGGGGAESWTARLMSAPGGQLLVAAVGLGIVAVGGALVHRGWSEKFRDTLDVKGTTGADGRAYVWFGKVGYLSKGAALGLIGGLVVAAAWTHDADKSAGMDQALKTLLDQPFGAPLLLAVAAGIGCFGLFCFAWARHLDR